MERDYYQRRRTEKIAAGKARYAQLFEADPAFNAKAYAKDPAARVAASRAWQIANPKRVSMIHAARRARKASAFVEHVDPDTLYTRDRGECGICRHHVDRWSMTIDHKVPLAAGGEHSYANCQIAHRSCNSSKGARVDRPAARAFDENKARRHGDQQSI